MRKLLLLPLTLPLAAARGALEAVVQAVVEALERDEDRWTPSAPPPPPPPASAAPARPTPVPERDIHDDEPTRGEVGRLRVEQREAEAGPGSVGAEVRVDAPWEGYGELTAQQILERLDGADTATRAVVRLYESTHRNRKTVLRATEE